MNKKFGINRRRFIKSSVAGTAGALISTSVMGNSLPVLHNDGVIVKRRLGKTDIEIPVVSFGVMRSDNSALVKSAFQMGYGFFDTAHGYQEGKNETMLGELFSDVPRKSFLLATKVSPDDVNRDTGEFGPGARDSLLAKFELSLKRLRMNYVDILYLHGVSNSSIALAPQLIDALMELKKQGKVRYVGMSTHKNEPDVIQAAIDSNFYDVVLTAINFSQAHAPAIKEKIALAGAKGIGIVAMKTMAGGFLDKERQKPVNCVAALKWVLEDKNICTSIPGIVTYDQMIQNFSVMQNLALTEQEKAELEAAKLLTGLYCDGCGQCVRQCKRNLPVSEMMRAYMYTYGYRQAELAYRVLEETAMLPGPCGDCADCTVKCYKGIPVAERIADVSRLISIPRDMLATL